MTAADDRGHWRAGDHVVFRQVWPGGVWAAFPATIVEDSPSRIAVYVRPGTTFAGPVCTRDEHLRVAASGRWELRSYKWVGQHHVWSAVPGEPVSVWTLWTDQDWEHLGWKLNPEAPWRRTLLGFDTTDYALDAVISPDLTSWAWKDEDEFAEAIDLGLISDDDAEQIRSATSTLASEVLTSQRGMLKKWSAWRPPAEWVIPTLASDWAEL